MEQIVLIPLLLKVLKAPNARGARWAHLGAKRLSFTILA
jgi:hypothetical protein